MSQIYVLTSVSVQVWPDHILRAAQTCFQEGAHVLDLNQTFHEDVMCDMPQTLRVYLVIFSDQKTHCPQSPI